MRVRLELGVVGRPHDQRAGADEMVEQRLRERGALGRIGAGPKLVEQHQRAFTGLVDDARDGAQVAAERGQRLGYRLLVADVGEDVAKHGHRAAGCHRHVQARLVHQHQESDRP